MVSFSTELKQKVSPVKDVKIRFGSLSYTTWCNLIQQASDSDWIQVFEMAFLGEYDFLTLLLQSRDDEEGQLGDSFGD